MQPILAFFGVSPGETAVVLVAILLLFGAKRLPGIARSLGRSIGEFRRAASSLSAEVMREALPDRPTLPDAQKDSTGSDIYLEEKTSRLPEDSERHAG